MAKAKPTAKEKAEDVAKNDKPDDDKPVKINADPDNQKIIFARFEKTCAEYQNHLRSTRDASRRYLAGGAPLVLLFREHDYVFIRFKAEVEPKFRNNSEVSIKPKDGPEAVIGKCLAPDDRRQANVFKSALSYGCARIKEYTDDKNAEDLFLTVCNDAGGIEKMRRASSGGGGVGPTAIIREAWLKAGTERVKELPARGHVAMSIKGAEVAGLNVLLLGVTTGGGRVEVKHMFRDDTAIKKALENLGSMADPDYQISLGQTPADAVKDLLDQASANQDQATDEPGKLESA